MVHSTRMTVNGLKARSYSRRLYAIRQPPIPSSLKTDQDGVLSEECVRIMGDNPIYILFGSIYLVIEFVSRNSPLLDYSSMAEQPLLIQ